MKYRQFPYFCLTFKHLSWENRITSLEVSNFKSVRHVVMDCERINLLVGKPNVGKSNLLEALALAGPTFLNTGNGFAKPLVRYEQAANLFYDQNYFEEKITVHAKGIGKVTLWNDGSLFQFEMERLGIGSVSAAFQMNGIISQFNVANNKVFSPVKAYQFPEKQIFEGVSGLF